MHEKKLERNIIFYKYGKQRKYEEGEQREYRQQAIADDLFLIFKSHTMPAKAALDVIERAKEMVLKNKEQLDYEYQHQSRYTIPK